MSCTTLISRVYKPGVDANNPFPTTAPVVAHAKTVTLTCPYIVPVATIILRGPELHNTLEPHQKRVLRQSRNGTLLCASDPFWSRFVKMNYVFIALKQVDAAALQSFVQLSLGLEIGLLDFDGRQWRGYITSPDGEVSQLGRGCQWSGKLTFELELT